MNHFDQYYLFADESIQDGTLFSNFYGGALVPQAEYEGVRERLLKCNFGFAFRPNEVKPFRLRLFLDRLPDTKIQLSPLLFANSSKSIP